MIESILQNLVADKRKSLYEEKLLKINQIEFEYEKYMFSLEKNSTIISNISFCNNRFIHEYNIEGDDEIRKIESDKIAKIERVEEEYFKKELREIEELNLKYSKTELGRPKA